MAVGSILGFDIDMTQLTKADNKIENMVQNSARLKQNLTEAAKAFSEGNTAEIITRMQRAIEQIGNKKVTPDFDTSKAERLHGVLGSIVEVVKILSKATLFDSENISKESFKILELQNRLAKVNEEISKIEKDYKKLSSIKAAPFDVFKKTDDYRTGLDAYLSEKGVTTGPRTKAYREAKEAYEKQAKEQAALWLENSKHELEVLRSALQEKKKQLSEELAYSKKTADEKVQYNIQAQEKILKADEARIKKAQRDYSATLKEMSSIMKSNDKLSKQNTDGSLDTQIRGQEVRFAELNERRKTLEAEYGQFVVETAKKNQVQLLEIEAKRIIEKKKLEQKQYEESWQKYIRTPEGAIEMSKDAKSINDERRAIELLIAARDGLSKTTANYRQIVDDLNSRIQKHRISVEQLTIAEKNEKSLQPAVRNEYERLLKEMDKVADAKVRLAKTEAFAKGDSKAVKDYNALLAYEKDLAKRKAEIEENAQGLLDAVHRKHVASRAQFELSEIERTERQKFEIERKNLLELQEKRRQIATRSTTRANSIVDQTDASKNIAQEEQAIRRLREAIRHLDKTNKDEYERTLQRLNEAIAKHTHNIKMATDATYREAQAKKKLQQQNTTYDGAMKFSKETKTIEQQRKAIEYLKQAREKLSRAELGESAYRAKLRDINMEIDRQQRSIDALIGKQNKLRNSQNGLTDTMGQLQRRIALMFSVSQIQSYIGKIIQVRKEFELQHTALRSMLQDRDAADKIWQQTIDLAVKSPFRVKELVTYTKQLSAYRIETDKLHSTTKMLADVSAGLGVDMNRLILAYGQVRAAEYLRGTELRQFTDAGIPMLEELAKHFTSLEGRAISTADVFERISKRMVSFGDVTAVFQKMTSEGGAFYRMQEKQSETLYGIISNLHDSFDLMMNDIGKSNEGTIKNTLEGIKKLVDAWRDVAFAIKTVAYTTIVPYTAIMTTLRVANSKFAEDLLVFATRYQTTSKMLLSTERFFVGMLQKMGAGSAVVRGFMKVLGGIATLGVAGAIAGIVIGLTVLITKMTSASRAAKRLKKELDEIYNEDVTNFKKQIQGFDTLLTKLKQVDKGSREHFNIIDKLNSQYGEHIGFIVNETTSYEQLAKTVDKVNKSLTVKAKLNTFEKAYSKAFEETNKQILKAQESLRKSIEKANIKRDGLTFIPDEEDINNIFANFEKKVKESGKKITDWAGLQKVFEDYGLKLGADTIYWSQDLVAYSNAILSQKEAELKIEQKINNLYDERSVSSIEAREAFEDLEKRRQAALAENAKATKWEIEDIQKEFDNEERKLEIKFGIGNKDALVKEANETIDDINNKIKDSASTIGKEYANAIYIDSAEAEKGVGKIAEDTAAAYKVQKEIIKEQEALKAAGTKHDEDILTHAKKTAAALKYKLQIMGRTDFLQKEQIKEENKELQLLNKQIAALKEAKQAYDKLRERHDVEESTKRTSDAFKTLFNEVQMGDITEGMQFSLQGLIDVLDKLPNKAGEKGKQAIEKIKAEWQGGIGLDVKINKDKKLLDRIEEMFSGYELSLELEKLNIPPDIAKRLFKVDFVSLDELKSQLQDLKPQFVGTEMEDEYLKFVKKVSELEDKELNERMKRYTDFLKKGQTERVKIKLDELRQLAALEDDYNNNRIEEQDYKLSKQGIQEEASKKLQSLEWDEFKESDTYIRMFEDLDYASKKSIEGIIERLKDMRENLKELSPTEIKEITNAIERLEDAVAQKNPFKGLVESIKPYISYLKEREELEEKYRSSQKAEANLTSVYKQEADNVSKLQVEYEKISKSKTATPEEKANAYDMLETAKQRAAFALDELEKQGLISKELADQIRKGEKIKKTFKESLVGVADYAEQAFNALPEVASNLENVFGEMSPKLKDAMDSVSAIGGATMSAVKNFASGNYIGAIVDVTKVVGEFFKIGDKRRERQIQRELKAVEKLSKEYEKLQKKIEDAFTLYDLQQSGKQSIDNLEKQKESYEKIIAAEEAKKKSDSDKIDEYKEKLEELEESIEETRKEIFSKATDGILDDVLSTAREFVDAWYDAFKETGDGMKGLEDNFNEMLLNMVKQQAAMTIVSPFIDSIKKKLQQYINENDTELSIDEAANWVQMVKEGIPGVSEGLKAVFDAFKDAGLDLGSASGELSGLQRGIQGITEETAQIIEAYLNAIRMTVVDNGSKMSSVISSLESISNSISNTMVGYLKTVAEQTSAINSLLEGVRTSNTQAIRVELVN